MKILARTALLTILGCTDAHDAAERAGETEAGVDVELDASASIDATVGSIPRDAIVRRERSTSMTIDWPRVPDFVEVLARDGGLAGYVKRSDLMNVGTPGQVRRIPVYDESLQRLVGHMVDGRGFVPLGVRDEDVPPFGAQ